MSSLQPMCQRGSSMLRHSSCARDIHFRNCSPAASSTRCSRRAALVCSSQHNFLLYTKPECPLCDGLKDRVQALIDRAQFMPSFLTGATLEVRDISSSGEWYAAMHLSVPVLAVVDEQGDEVVLPRPQPRMTADRLQRHLEEALAAVGSAQQQQ